MKNGKVRITIDLEPEIVDFTRVYCAVNKITRTELVGALLYDLKRNKEKDLSKILQKYKPQA